MTDSLQRTSPETEALIAKAQAFVDRKYVARADARQKEMGLAYVEAERQDLAREIVRFVEPYIANAGDMLLRMGEAVDALRAERDQLRGLAQRSKDDAIAVALFDLVAIIEAAGLQNLVKGVELGQTSWYVKASDRIAAAYAALSDTSTDSEGK